MTDSAFVGETANSVYQCAVKFGGLEGCNIPVTIWGKPATVAASDGKLCIGKSISLRPSRWWSWIRTTNTARRGHQTRAQQWHAKPVNVALYLPTREKNCLTFFLCCLMVSQTVEYSHLLRSDVHYTPVSHKSVAVLVFQCSYRSLTLNHRLTTTGGRTLSLQTYCCVLRRDFRHDG